MADSVELGGATSVIVTVEAIVISTGLPYTAGAHNTSGLTVKYVRDGGTETAITPVSATAGTYTSSGFVHAGQGEYEIGAPTAATAAGVKGVRFKVTGITDVLFRNARIELSSADPRSATLSTAANTAIADAVVEAEITAIKTYNRSANETATITGPTSGSNSLGVTTDATYLPIKTL